MNVPNEAPHLGQEMDDRADTSPIELQREQGAVLRGVTGALAESCSVSANWASMLSSAWWMKTFMSGSSGIRWSRSTARPSGVARAEKSKRSSAM